MKSKHLALLGVGLAAAYLLWKRANDPARIQAQGDAALTQAAKMQAAGQAIPDTMKTLIAKVHGTA